MQRSRDLSREDAPVSNYFIHPSLLLLLVRMAAQLGKIEYAIFDMDGLLGK
jgi:hypothetical protein